MRAGHTALRCGRDRVRRPDPQLDVASAANRALDSFDVGVGHERGDGRSPARQHDRTLAGEVSPQQTLDISGLDAELGRGDRDPRIAGISIERGVSQHLRPDLACDPAALGAAAEHATQRSHDARHARA